MNNVVYGKTMENLRNRVDVRLVNNEKDCLKGISKRSYVAQRIFGNDLAAIFKKNPNIFRNAHIRIM